MKPSSKSISRTNAPAHNIVWLLGLILFLNSLMGVYRYSTSSPTIDFFTWWAVNHGLAHQFIDMPYTNENQKILADKIAEEIQTQKKPNVEKRTFTDVLKLYKGRIAATATPFYYVIFSRFFSDDYLLDKQRFIWFSLVCFTLSVLILGRLLKHAYATLFLFYAFIANFFSPYLIEIKVGNINELQLLLITAFIYFFVKRKHAASVALSGLSMGFCVLLKPNTCFILFCAAAILLSNKQFKETAGLCAGFLVSLLLAFWEVSSYFKALTFDIWSAWLKTFPLTISGSTFSIVTGNYSLSKLILTYAGFNASVFLYGLCFSMFFACLFMYNRHSRLSGAPLSQAMKEEKNLKEAFYAVGFGILIMIISSGLVWSHYYLLVTIPLFLFFLRPDEQNEPHFQRRLILIISAMGLTSAMISKISPALLCSIFYNIVAIMLLILLVQDMALLNRFIDTREKK